MIRKTKKRIHEIIPGATTWTILILSIVLSFFKPLWVIYFIIAFDLFWLFRIVHFTLLMFVAWRSYKKEITQDWLAKVVKISDWGKIYHYVVFPTYLEPLEVLEATLDSVLKSDYPAEKMIVHIAGEDRVRDEFLPKQKFLQEKYGDKFFKLMFTLHPDGVVGELKGKGANAHYAGKHAKKEIDKLGLVYENVICSYFDSDTVVHEKYFSNLTYKYLTVDEPTKKVYQPAVVYNNNIWEAPFFTRITAFGTVFWLLTELVRPEKMYTFSSHSIPFKALVDFNFWQKDIVTDDSRVFLQGFFRYSGNFTVVPMYVPVSMDTVMDDTAMQSARNLYKQQRRWAWGVEHFPYLMEQYKKHPEISKVKKFKYAFHALEGMVTWALAPILIFILGRLPLFVASFMDISSSVIVQNTPFILEWLMGISMMGLIISASFSILLLPQKPQKYSQKKWLIMLLQWIFLPITLVLFGSIPAIESQTRLMLGKKYHLGFWVTPKKRK